MQLREWISELNAASTECALVDVVGAFVKAMARDGTLPEHCLPDVPGNATEIRRTAAALARLQVSSCTGDDERGAYHQLLVLFSLASDRIAMLEARGLLVPTGRPQPAPVPPLAASWQESFSR